MMDATGGQNVVIRNSAASGSSSRKRRQPPTDSDRDGVQSNSRRVGPNAANKASVRFLLSQDDIKVHSLPTTEAPYINGDWPHLILDTSGKRLFVYSGAHHNDVRADLRYLDLATRRWHNLTPGMKYQPSSFPGIGANPSRTFPSLNMTATAFVTIDDNDFLLFFGGINADEDTTSSKLYMINVSSNRSKISWSEVHVRNGPVCPRANSVMVPVQTDTWRLYVFGGRASDDADARLFNSYSVAKLEQQDGDRFWTWEEKDVECSSQADCDVPALGFDGQAVSINGGKQILLTTGRKKEGEIEFNGMAIVVFDTVGRFFQLFKRTKGTFPRDLEYYYTYPVEGPSATEGVILGGFWPATAEYNRDKNYYESELWMYQPWPQDQFKCLSVRRAVWDLNLSLKNIIVYNDAGTDKIIFLGNDDPYGKNAKYNRLVEIAADVLI